MNPEMVVVNLVALNGGELIGSTRLQKQAYLVHYCGANLDELDFVYHHYGPYSFDLADGCIDAEVAGWITTEEHPRRYGVRYTTYKVTNRSPRGARRNIGDLAEADAKRVVDDTNRVSSVALELAATAAFLQRQGIYDDVLSELKLRKSHKATHQNLERAQQLLEDLGVDALRDMH